MSFDALSFDYLYRGRCEYGAIYREMHQYTHSRNAQSRDQFWLLEHEAVYTRGRRQAKSEMIKDIHSIPIISSDRGGLSSYHGPGQAILYTLLDLRRRHITLRTYINMLEETVIILLARYGIAAHCRPGAPGVYVSQAKIASLALCVYKGCCYHGIALNVDMDLTPFDAIVPCGLAGVKMTQMADYGVQISAAEACYLLADILAERLNSHCGNDTLAS